MGLAVAVWSRWVRDDGYTVSGTCVAMEATPSEKQVSETVLPEEHPCKYPRLSFETKEQAARRINDRFGTIELEAHLKAIDECIDVSNFMLYGASGVPVSLQEEKDYLKKIRELKAKRQVCSDYRESLLGSS